MLVTDIKYLPTKAGFLIDYKIMSRKWLQYLDIQKHLVKTSIRYLIQLISLRKNICVKSFNHWGKRLLKLVVKSCIRGGE